MTGLLTPTHMIILVVIALVVFGPKRLPELGKGLGAGFRDFKGSLEGHHDEHAVEAPAAVEAQPAKQA